MVSHEFFVLCEDVELPCQSLIFLKNRQQFFCLVTSLASCDEFYDSRTLARNIAGLNFI